MTDHNNLDSDELQLARELLFLMSEIAPTITAYVFSDKCMFGFGKYSERVINWLATYNFIVCNNRTPINDSGNAFINYYVLTDMGKAFNKIGVLSTIDVEENKEKFFELGNEIYSILEAYYAEETNMLARLLTVEEQDSYSNYYRLMTYESIKNRGKNSTDTIRENGLKNMFSLSVLLGEKDDNDRRTYDYVLKKCVEELGELSLEIQIDSGLSYKEPGADGIEGEAVDLAICAMDMFALQYPGLSPEQIEAEFYKKMNEKLEKWKRTIGM
ncbi:hypothetical protein GAP32_127 [Cronobacter phage vB_CsaM_GAP32]|uniref:Uncharacterized protein n=1 Tax=Cronobacter phage vB_CsaM_GAP32 TaxID=1141136 RepID=K4F7A4_9CAUD|nr:hypothetical protein GAP32_127 [Cronobacter phage vB_CsaM_GAP32]AFC21577.1 hypothetical protein GAP32_127 [Cronobacter phage vB_CsaM_GAP32]